MNSPLPTEMLARHSRSHRQAVPMSNARMSLLLACLATCLLILTAVIMTQGAGEKDVNPTQGTSFPIATGPLPEAVPLGFGVLSSSVELRSGGEVRTTNAELNTSSVSPQAPGRFRIKGLVLGTDGIGIVGVTVSAHATEDRFPRVAEVSKDSGDFALVLPEDIAAAVIQANDARYSTVMASYLTNENRNSIHRVIIAPSDDLAGVVEDEDGYPVPDVLIRLDIPSGALSGIREVLATARRVKYEGNSDHDGRFRIAAMPAVPSAHLRVTRDGFISQTIPIRQVRESGRIILERDEGVQVVSGVVYKPDGMPCRGATVRTGTYSTLTLEDGTFELEFLWDRYDKALVAIKEGYQAAVTPDVSLEAEGAVTLRLGSAPLSLAGRIVYSDGRPCRRWKVQLTGGTVVSSRKLPVTYVESLLSGEQGGVETDREGNFSFHGLIDRPGYGIRAWDPYSLDLVKEDVEQLDKKLEIIVPVPTMIPLHGHVVGLDRRPVASVKVRFSLDEFASSRGGRRSLTGATTTSNEEGEFRLRPVPLSDEVYLRLSGPNIIDQKVELYGVSPQAPIEVVVARYAKFQVENSGNVSSPTHIEILDSGGNNLTMYEWEGAIRIGHTRYPLVDGSSSVLGVDERATSVIFYKESARVSERSLFLGPNINVIQSPLK